MDNCNELREENEQLRAQITKLQGKVNRLVKERDGYKSERDEYRAQATAFNAGFNPSGIVQEIKRLQVENERLKEQSASQRLIRTVFSDEKPPHDFEVGNYTGKFNAVAIWAFLPEEITATQIPDNQLRWQWENTQHVVYMHLPEAALKNTLAFVAQTHSEHINYALDDDIPSPNALYGLVDYGITKDQVRNALNELNKVKDKKQEYDALRKEIFVEWWDESPYALKKAKGERGKFQKTAYAVLDEGIKNINKRSLWISSIQKVLMNKDD